MSATNVALIIYLIVYCHYIYIYVIEVNIKLGVNFYAPRVKRTSNS
jgi:hypothetical protein